MEDDDNICWTRDTLLQYHYLNIKSIDLQFYPCLKPVLAWTVLNIDNINVFLATKTSSMTLFRNNIYM